MAKLVITIEAETDDWYNEHTDDETGAPVNIVCHRAKDAIEAIEIMTGYMFDNVVVTSELEV